LKKPGDTCETWRLHCSRMGVFALISSVSVEDFPKLANVQHRKSTLIDWNGYRLTFFRAKMYLTSDTTSEQRRSQQVKKMCCPNLIPRIDIYANDGSTARYDQIKIAGNVNDVFVLIFPFHLEF
jgi:hypothetical protein